MTSVSLTELEGRQLAASRRLRALAGPAQVRLVATALLAFLLLDLVRLALAGTRGDSLATVMDALAYVALGVLLWRPRLGLVLGAIPLAVGLVWPSTSMELVLLFLMAAMGCAQLSRREASAMSILLAAFAVLRIVLYHGVERMGVALLVLPVVTAGLGLGWTLLAVRLRRERSEAALAERAQEVARIRQDERDAITRELHDVVVHQLSNVSLQVLGAQASTDPDELHVALQAIDEANDEALTDLRLLMTVLRQATLAHAPGVELQELTQRIPPTLRAAAAERDLVQAGFEPDVVVPASADGLSMTVQNTVSRIMAEAVTNVIRHAPAKVRCVLRITVTDTQVSVQVRNAVAPGAVTPPPGWGLQALGERVNLTGGSFRAGVLGDEWVVAATLPRV